MTLESQFDHAMLAIYTRAKSEAGYNASKFLDMLDRHRGLLTAKILINSPEPSEGYANLHQLGRLDLTVEAVVTDNPRWHSLFSTKELDRARKRLRQYEYKTRPHP